MVVYGASYQQRVRFYNRELKLLSVIGIIITATAFKYIRQCNTSENVEVYICFNGRTAAESHLPLTRRW